MEKQSQELILIIRLNMICQNNLHSLESVLFQ